ncbi:MAG: hypothetical protein OEQ47_06480 [Acidimicrobiia bacterium]|nr:hypothetical protein [Acidimicrobiia bacterium]
MHPLEKRREMSGTFPGRIVLVEGDEVDVDLQIASDKIRLATPFAEIGLWDRDSIHFERTSTGGYELSVADDVVTFYPADVEAFDDAVDDLLDEAEEPVEEAPIPAVSLVTAPLDADTAPDRAEPSPDPVSSDPVSTDPDADDEPAARFGPSSRERLAAAMSGFRQRQVDESSETESTDDAGSDVPPARTSSPGFVIPGDDDYGRPTGEEHEGAHRAIHFDEDLEDDTVADQILESARSLRSARSLSFDRAKLKKIGIAAIAIAAAIGLVFAIPVVIGFFSGSDEATPATAPQTTVPVTTPQATTPATTDATVVDPTVAVEPLAFDLASDAFVERWNETAARVSPNLRFRSSLPASDFEVGFTAHIAMIGSFAGPGSGLDAYTLEIDPTGPSSSDQLGIQALGLAIAVADPSLEPGERAAVLAEMGLNIRDPQLGGLNGTTSRNGVVYRLVFDSDDFVLRLTIAPQSP